MFTKFDLAMRGFRDGFKTTTNGNSRPLLFWSDLTEKEQAEFDFFDSTCGMDYFRFKGEVYSLDQFVPPSGRWSCLADGHPYNQWDGHLPDSFFSTVVIKYPREFGYIDSENIIVGTVTY